MSTSFEQADCILVFGAKDHIGAEVVKYIHQKQPHVKIKVATHDANNLALLEAMFPFAHAVHADLLDYESLSAALDGVEGVFQVSPDVFNEDLLVKNMKNASKHAGTVKHIIRILGTPPGVSMDLIPEKLKKYRHYPAMQHLLATQLYRDAELPVTFINVAGYYMDDFSRMFSPSIIERKAIEIAFDKRLAWVDPIDVAQVSAELLINPRNEYVGKVIDVTGPDLMTFAEVAKLFSRVWKEEITYNGDEAVFLNSITPVFSKLWGEEAPAYFMEYFKWETEHASLFKITDHVENILGRSPIAFEEWAVKNADFFTQAWQAKKSAPLVQS
ncbi:NmrA family NAD(P)-binding protein [Pseudoalteromonas sp. JBTF-M23]|uniref:NmrA family NAD(P)-binding protein n=1 Tax=Pseudoalteromonas caenipelagi TaxID=2726988 RepID=A0A849VD74_9GAMM|nr:NmrA family NAD(P)-binding protein [Pseudoalteromonas caenipelagi]NOU51025.1 NmrA family NAD(P)-binding protein [Pseudoalteromonas caenipelagi]